MRSQIRLFKVVAATAVVLTAFIAASCDDDPVSPEPSGTPDYHIYFDYDGTAVRPEFMPVYSTKSLQAVDTLNGNLSDFLFTPDGKYMVAYDAYFSEIKLVDMASGATVATDTGAKTLSLSLSATGEFVLAGRRMNSAGLLVLGIDGLTRVWRDTVPNRLAEFVGKGTKLVYSEPQNDTLYVVDYVNAPEQRAKFQGGSGFYPYTLSFDTFSGNLYAIGRTSGSAYTLRVYGSDLSLLSESALPDNFRLASMAFSPDGTLAYLAAPFAEGSNPPGVLSYSVASQSLDWFIDATQIVSPALAPQDLEITPDGKTLCILSHLGYGISPGNIFLYSTESGGLIKVFQHQGGLGLQVRVFPLPR